MDEDYYRSTISNIVTQECAFERSLLARHCDCSQSHRFNLAEREGIRCEAGLRNQNCIRLKEFLRESVNFTFHLKDSNEKLPYAKQIKMQAGGLLSLQKLLSNEDDITKVQDVYQLVINLENQYSDFSQLPMVDILKEISTFKVRHRSK